MRYIKEEPFLDRRGEVVTSKEMLEVTEGMTKADINELRPFDKQWQTGELLAHLAGQWTAGVRELNLNIKEIRCLQTGLDILEGSKGEEGFRKGYWCFEDDVYKILQKVTIGIIVNVPVFSAHAPQFEDMLEKALRELTFDTVKPDKPATINQERESVQLALNLE
jgi:hypothetical protein